MHLINDFKDCMPFSFKDLGKTATITMQIKLKSEEPVVYNPYRICAPEEQVLNNMLAELLERGIIRESRSSYASPVILVKKTTGDYRMCIDYSKLNAITVQKKYSLPPIEDQIDRLGNKNFFIGLDLASGFYQVPMVPDSIDNTAVYRLY